MTPPPPQVEKFLSHCCFMSGSYDSDGDGYGALHRRLETWEELMGATGGGVRDNGRQNGDNGNGEGAVTASNKVRGRGAEENGVARAQGDCSGYALDRTLHPMPTAPPFNVGLAQAPHPATHKYQNTPPAQERTIPHTHGGEVHEVIPAPHHLPRRLRRTEAKLLRYRPTRVQQGVLVQGHHGEGVGRLC